MAWSMWNAPSDRDYYGDYDPPELDDYCIHCGASDIQPCEPHCLMSLPADEPADANEADTELKEVA